MYARQRHRQGYGGEDHHIKWQDVEIGRHVAQREQLDDMPCGIGEEPADPQKGGIAGLQGRDDKQRHEEQCDMAAIKLGGAPSDAGRAGREAHPAERTAEGDRRREAGDEHEHMRGIRQAEPRPDDFARPPAGHMGEEDRDQGQAAKEVKARIARLLGAALMRSGRPPANAARDRAPRRAAATEWQGRRAARGRLP